MYLFLIKRHIADFGILAITLDYSNSAGSNIKCSNIIKASIAPGLQNPTGTEKGGKK
jgi:hypothetical protein